MKTPFALFQDKILVPVYNFKNKYINRDMLHKGCKNVANFIFDKSKETALILLTLNAISTISSHLAQIKGLKKNKRENSDYLINQEWQELGLDMAFTIIPPFLLNNFLMKKLDSGQWTTKSAREKLLYTIAPTVGATKNDLYNTQHIVPVKETLGGMTAEAIKKIRDTKKVSPKLEKVFNLMERSHYVRMPDPNKSIPLAAMENITTDFDTIRKNSFKGFYNGSAYDEISGQRNGILIMAAIAYTTLASCIITPIIKNKLANRSYKKHMEKLKKNASKVQKTNVQKPVNWYINSDTNVFSSFSENISSSNKIKEPVKSNNVFDSFNQISSHNYGMRI